MRRIPISSSIILVCVSTFLIHAQPVKKHGALKVIGTQLCDSNNNPLVLRGVSYGWHNWWPRFYNGASVKWLADDWKVSVVRAAMGIEPGNGYIDNPQWSTEKVKTIIDAAIASDIYVIIDWHSHNINQQEAIAFFKEMARTYGKHPHVIYEIFNEPDQETWPEIKKYCIAVIKEIRAIDPDNIILVGSGQWDQNIHIAADDPITGFDNLMYSLHFYAATHKQWLRERGDYAMGKGLALFVSESAGMKADGDGDLDYPEWNSWISWMETNKISWVIWSIADKNESSAMLLRHASSEGGWSAEDLKESGIKTRELIRKYNTP